MKRKTQITSSSEESEQQNDQNEETSSSGSSGSGSGSGLGNVAVVTRGTAVAASSASAAAASAVVTSNQLVVAAPQTPGNFLAVLKPGQFSLITSQTKSLSVLGNCYDNLFQTCRMVISSEGVSATCFDEARTCMSRWLLTRADMIEGIFNPPAKTIEAVIDMQGLKGLLDASQLADAIRLSFDDDEAPSKLFIDLTEGSVAASSSANGSSASAGGGGNGGNGGMDGRLDLNLNVDDEFLDIPPLKYHNQVTVSAEKLNRILHLGCDEKRVQFDLTATHFNVRLFNNRGSMNFGFPLDKNSDTVVPSLVISPQTFYLPNILNIMRITKATKFVSISMPEPREVGVDENGQPILDRKNAKPLCISVQLAALGSVIFATVPYFRD